MCLYFIRFVYNVELRLARKNWLDVAESNAIIFAFANVDSM